MVVNGNMLCWRMPKLKLVIKNEPRTALDPDPLRCAFEQSIQGLAVVDLSGRTVEVNRAFGEITGYPVQELLGMNLCLLVFGAAHMGQSLLTDLLHGNRNSLHKEKEILHRQGWKTWISATVSCIRNNRTEADFLLFQIEDITERKCKELQAEEDIQRFRSLKDHNPAGILACDLDGLIREANPAMERITGNKEAEILGRNLRFLLAPGLGQEDGMDRDLLDEIRNFELTVVHKSGLRKILGVKNIPIFTFGKKTGTYIIARDITNFRETEASLRATRELLESLFQYTVDAIDVVDMDGRVIQVNKAFERMYGWTEDEALGKRLPIIPDHLLPEFDNIRRRMFNDESIIGYETVRQRKDGSLINVSVTASPMKNYAGEITAYAGITRDITESKQTEDILRKSDKLAIAGRIAAGLAHEIKNPLTSLKGFLQLLKSGVSEKMRYYDIMLSELERINFIASELLVIAKPQVMNFQPRNPIVLLQQVIALMEPEALMNNVRILLKGRKEYPLLSCSEIELKQVFINILKNAIEAMPNGGDVVVQAKLSAGGLLKLRFIDQGTGIPEEHIPKLGEPFYTTKEKGTGLGLMVSYRILEAHGGTMKVSSEVGFGTTVDIYLPLLTGE
jgi:PAS domain S-box-containing protein